uniref:S41 family peptidase n=1 Tax=Acetatifactor sp. TaxID=1872090 RepID=UPI0040561DF2
MVTLLCKAAFDDENKYDLLEMYLSDYYYSSENLVTAISNKLGDEREENSSTDIFLSLNFDNYIYQLVLEDINQYESDEIGSYNVYMNKEKCTEVLSIVEDKAPVEIEQMGDVCYIKIPGFVKDSTYDELKEWKDLLRQSRKFCNENTASASEAMMFSMKTDFGDKVEFVGNKTHGKNFCCSYDEFDDGEAFLFVSGYMGNAEGVTFADDGIEPDYYVEDEECIEKALELLQ